ncbi:PD-(D/E)XK nuclease domain-containing protein [Leptothrix cholodnii]|uniref:PD-(D/E)XK nuclease domain-containing protein n=1 Tax=Leptothrix cholodnii TaxID=34029 RepID=UPI0002FDA0C3|nr:PD-(D/E)XK nuclease domain-containing protein [Leptothrix cholodnii]
MSLNRVLLPSYGVPERVVLQSRLSLLDALIQIDPLAIETSLRALFAGIPSDWYRRNPLAGFEGHYASVFYSHLAGLGLDLRVEDATNHGRIDLTVVLSGQVFLFEFKVVTDAPEGQVLRQIHEKGYAEKYLGQGSDVHLIGVEFSKTARNVVGFEVRTVTQ